MWVICKGGEGRDGEGKDRGFRDAGSALLKLVVSYMGVHVGVEN